MSITKNLGGDRLGSGAKMNVHLHEYERSTHNLSKTTRTTMAVGTIVPIYREFVQKNDSWEIDLNALMLTHPTEGPLFGSFKLQIDVFFAPLRLYIGKLHMNLLEEATKMETVKFPQLNIVANNINWNIEPNNQQINQSCILQYLGIRGLGYDENPLNNFVQRQFNAVPYLAYWDIYGQYYSNKPEKVGYVIHNVGLNGDIDNFNVLQNNDEDTYEVLRAPQVSAGVPELLEDCYITINVIGRINPSNIYVQMGNSTTTVQLSEVFDWIEENPLDYSIRCQIPKSGWVGVPLWSYSVEEKTDDMPQLYEFPLTNINEMKMDILASVKSTNPYIIDHNSIAPYGLTMKRYNETWSKTISQEGLGLKTYQSDIFNNWLDNEDIEQINTRSRIQTDENGSFTMEQFLMTEKLYSYLNRAQLSGNTVDDWEEVNWGKSANTRPEKPIYEGGWSQDVHFDQVVSNSASENQPLGTIAGKGELGGEVKGGRVSIKAQEHGYIIINASLTPRLDYYQGNKWDTALKTMEDIHKSAFDKIGFQNLPTEWMASWDTSVAVGVPTYKTAGKQPSWIHYQTNFNEVYGNFAKKSSEGWMVLTRDYEADGQNRTIADLTTYIDPAKWNDVFAYKARDAQNFWAQFHTKAIVRRVMSANQIPGL